MSRHAYVMYCDDVRREVGGKTSLIGVYPGAITFPRFPAFLPKLCVFVNAVTRVDKPFKNISFRGYHLGHELFDMQLDETQVADHYKDPENQEGVRFYKVKAMAILSFLTFDEPGPLKIEVVADGEVIDCPSIPIRLKQAKTPEE